MALEHMCATPLEMYLTWAHDTRTRLRSAIAVPPIAVMCSHVAGKPAARALSHPVRTATNTLPASSALDFAIIPRSGPPLPYGYYYATTVILFEPAAFKQRY
jgi:hypothetical protein